MAGRHRVPLRCASARYLHQLPEYRFDVDAGMGDFLTPDGLKTIAVEYQSGLLDRINEIVQGLYDDTILTQTC